MPEWSNGLGLGPSGLVPTQVRTKPFLVRKAFREKNSLKRKELPKALFPAALFFFEKKKPALKKKH